MPIDIIIIISIIAIVSSIILLVKNNKKQNVDRGRINIPTKKPRLKEIISFSFILSIISYATFILLLKLVAISEGDVHGWSGLGMLIVFPAFCIYVLLLVNFTARAKFKTEIRTIEWKIFLSSLFWCLIFLTIYITLTLQILF